MSAHGNPKDLVLCTECRQAVRRAYRELRQYGQDDVSAFRAAVRVLALRHPDRAPHVYRDVVAELLSLDQDS
jgi:hypothetical protein